MCKKMKRNILSNYHVAIEYGKMAVLPSHCPFSREKMAALSAKTNKNIPRLENITYN